MRVVGGCGKGRSGYFSMRWRDNDGQRMRNVSSRAGIRHARHEQGQGPGRPAKLEVRSETDQLGTRRERLGGPSWWFDSCGAGAACGRWSWTFRAPACCNSQCDTGCGGGCCRPAAGPRGSMGICGGCGRWGVQGKGGGLVLAGVRLACGLPGGRKYLYLLPYLALAALVATGVVDGRARMLPCSFLFLCCVFFSHTWNCQKQTILQVSSGRVRRQTREHLSA